MRVTSQADAIVVTIYAAFHTVLACLLNGIFVIPSRAGLYATFSRVQSKVSRTTLQTGPTSPINIGVGNYRNQRTRSHTRPRIQIIAGDAFRTHFWGGADCTFIRTFIATMVCDVGVEWIRAYFQTHVSVVAVRIQR